jgi:hypothetical protein
MARNGKHSGKHRVGEYGPDTPAKTVSEISRHELLSAIVRMILGGLAVLGGILVYVCVGDRGGDVEASLGVLVRYKGVLSGLLVAGGIACIIWGGYKMRYKSKRL